MKKLTSWWAAFVLAVGLGLTAPGTAAAHGDDPYCGIWWGSRPEASRLVTSGHVEDVRSGRHGCFDRLVVDVHGDRPGYWVRYVNAVHQEGSGNELDLRGGAFLEIVVRAPAYDESGRATYVPADRDELVDLTGYTTFRQAAWGGSFEGQTTIGLGVRARLPFRVFLLDGPGAHSRLVIDVAHRW